MGSATRGDLAPALTLDDEDGRSHRIEDYRGQVVVVNFWATWCGPCRHEMPSLDRAAAALGDARVVFLAVNVGESAQAVADFLTAHPLRLTVLRDREQRYLRAWPVRALPTTVVLRPDGRIDAVVAGDQAWDAPHVVAWLRALAGPSQGRTEPR